MAQQLNMPQYDNRRIRFGFTISGSSTNFQLNTDKDFLLIDTLQSVRVVPYYGFGLGGIVSLKLGKFWNLRCLPSLNFAQRNLQYTFTNAAYNKDVEVESVYIDLPLTIQYKSDRVRNVRFYVIGGVRMSYDLASNHDAPRSLSKPIVAVKPLTYNWEVGAGFDLFFPFFKLSPELRFTQSFGNVLVKDDYVYTTSLSSLFSRIVTFSLHFE